MHIYVHLGIFISVPFVRTKFINLSPFHPEIRQTHRCSTLCFPNYFWVKSNWQLKSPTTLSLTLWELLIRH